MLSFLALALSLVSAVAQTQWQVSSVNLTYVSGTYPDSSSTLGLVSPSAWHDTVTTPLVLKFFLVRGATGALFPLSTPSSSWLQVTSANAPSTLSSVVVISSPTISSDQSLLSYTITFTGAYGGYNITFDPKQLSDSQPVTGTSTFSNYFTFLAGYAPSVSIVNQGNVLTNTWLDPYSVNNVLTITSGSSSIGFFTSSSIAAPSSPCTICPQTNYTTPVAALSFTSIAYTSTGVTYNLSMLSANGPTPGSYPLPISAGLYQRSDGVYNYKVTQTVKVGFRPQIMFKDTSNYQGLDTSSCVSTPTFTSATERNVPAPTEYWFNADLSSIEMWVLPGLTAASASSGNPMAYMGEVVDYVGSGSPASLDAALGVSATSRPGASARSGGIQSSNAATSRSNGLYVGFPIATSGLSPGRYSFVIPAGTFMSVTGVYNARTVASLNIGFVPRIQVRANDGTDATGSWLDTSAYYSTYNLTLLPSVGYVLASPLLYTTGTAATIFDPIAGGLGSVTLQSLFANKVGQYSTASATFPMSLAGFTPNIALPLNVSSQALLRSDGVYSTFTYTSLKVGFVPTMSFSDQYSIVSNFLPSSYSLTYTVPPGTASPAGATWFSPANSSIFLSIGNGSQTLSTASPATTSGLFSGVTLGFNPTAVFSGSAVLSTPGFANYSLSLSSLSPGVYAVPIAPGSVCTALGVCNSRGLAYLFVGYDITTKLETLPSFPLVNASFNPADLANAYVSVPMFTPIDGYTALVPGVSSASSWRLNISAGAGFYFPSTTVSTFATYAFDTSVCNSCPGMSEPAVNFLNAPTIIGGGPSPCAMTVTSDTRTTYSSSSGGSDFASISTAPGCTVGMKSWTSATVSGPFGKYILRVPSGSLQRDDGVFNAQLEYPVVFGVPLSVTPQTLSSAPTASYPWLSPLSQYQLAITVPTFSNAVTFTYAPVNTPSNPPPPPPFSYNTSGSLFSGQSSFPFQPGMIGLAPLTYPSSGPLTYEFSFDATVSYGQRIGYISPGILDFKPTTGTAKIRNAASYFTLSVGFLPTLSLVDGTGSALATTATNGVTNGKKIRSGSAISSTYVTNSMADTFASSIFFSVAYPSGLLSQAAALSPPNFADISALSVLKNVGGVISLHTFTTPYASPSFITNHSGTFALNWQIAGPTFSPASGVVGLPNAISGGVSTTFLSSIGIDGGKLCVAGICNAGISLAVPMASNFISAAGAFPATLSPVSFTATDLGLNNLFGWLDGDGNETPYSFPISTQASSVKVYFTFSSAPSGTPVVSSSSSSVAISSASVTGTTIFVYTISGLASAGQGKYDITITPSDGTFQPQTVRIYYGFDVRAYPYVRTDVISTTSTITTPGEFFRSGPNSLSISKTDINLAFPGLTFPTATLPFSSLVTSVVDSTGRSVLNVITCYSSNAPTPCSVATPIGLTYPVTSASAPFSNPTFNPSASTPTSPPPSMYCGTSSYTLCGAFAYPINVGGLTDGVYTFTLTADPTLVKDFSGNTPTFNTTFTVIIDRTPPVASNTTSSFSPTAGLFGQAVRIPPAMFVDAMTPYSKLSFSLLTPVPGWSLVNGSTLTTGSLTVPRSDAPLVFLIQARDQAGNTAVAPLTVAISAPISSTLAASDIRGATALPGQPLKVSPAADGSVTLTLTATFGAPVGPMTPANLACSFSSSVNGASSVLLGVSSSPCGASSITVSPGDGVTKSRKFIYTVVIPATYAALILGNGAVQQMNFNIAGYPSITTAAGVAIEKLYTPISVLLDGRAPTFGQGFSLNYMLHPTVGVYYSQVLPYPLFSDNLSPPQSISLISATPSTQFGLTFSPGKQGIAAITGKVTAMPTSGLITWAITAQDEAGNVGTDARSFVLNVTTTPSTGTPILTMKSTPLAFTKGGAAINIDALSSISNMPTAGFPEMGFGTSVPWGTASAKIVVVLTSPDAGVPDASCTKAANTNADCEYVAAGAAFSASVVTNFDANTGNIVTIYTPSASTLLTAATINSFLASLQYVNTRSIVSGGNRVVSVFITSDATGHIAASATRTISVTTVDFAPVVATTTSTITSYCPTCSSPTASAIPLFTSVVISDADDSMMTSASVSLSSCDPSRDFLYVGTGTLSINAGVASQPGAFGGVVVDPSTGNRFFDRSVYGTWFPSTCTLLIKPIGSTAPISSFSAALAQVTYTNLQPSNPIGWGLNTGPSSISSYVTRGVSRTYSVTVTDAGAGGRSSSTLNSTSIAVTGTLWVEKYDTPAVINPRLAFGPGGFLYNKNVFAKTDYSYDSTGVINKRNFFVDRTVSSATIVLNLGVSSVNGTFAGGAITDVDSPLISSASPSVACTSPTPSGSISCSSTVTSQFTPATGVLTVTIPSPSATSAGSVSYTFTWASGVSVAFNVDFLDPGCTLAGASNVVTSSLLSTTLPSNSLCVFPPTVVSATANTTVISLGDFAASDATLSAAAASLAALGVPVSQQITAMTAQRVAARGASSVIIPPSSIVGAGSASISTSLPSTTQQSLLSKLPGSTSLDLSLGLILGPAGQTFSSPVRVCIFVGDTDAGYYRALYTSSQVSTTDPSKGFGPLTLLSNQAFNPATGQLCADTTHFSFFGPGLVPLPATPYVPKSTGMGGACPNTCSGQGTCRKDGKCQCFAGFMGYDCSSRACPSGASWGQSSGSGVGYFGNDVTAEPYASAHLDAECSGRGLCDRTKAACTCFAGFEGPACQRIACPKGCSGHGKCRFLSELPKAVGYSSWEAKRVQKCVCDAGYTGADCSQRLCPFGDDPETICSDTARQVQRVSLYFGSSPTSPFLPTAASTTDLVTSAQLALRFKAVDGATYTTNAIGSASVPVWGSTSSAAAAAATAMATALTSLPRGAVTGVSITADFTSSAAARTFDVTFTGPTNTGNEALMTCATNSDGYTLGCQTPGCRPFFRQPRLLNTNPSLAGVTNYITVAPAAILLQPSAIVGGNSAATVGQWGVQTTFTLNKLVSGAFTYSFSTSSIYGTSDGKATVTSPLPPLALRSTIAGPYGLLLSIVSDADLNSLVFTGTTTSVTVAYSWSLPTCNVTLVSSAAVDLEKAECANRGVCDRTLGQCKCFEGYSGSSCNAQVMYV